MDMKKLIYLMLAIITPLAWADDSVEAAITGNIVFEKAPELIMQDETLIIHKSGSNTLANENFSIDVDFHFKNISDHDVTRKIAFVLPPVRCRIDTNSLWNGLDADNNDSSENSGIKDFVTTVDGALQSYTTRTEAMLGDRNITALLTKLQIPLNPCKVHTTTEGEPDPRYSISLKNEHLLTDTNDAAWTENIYFEWTQTFPAGKVINIHHHYTPVIGESVLSARTAQELEDIFPKGTLPEVVIWNRSPSTLIQSHPSVAYTNTNSNENDSQPRFCIMPKWIQYQLTTGSNWNGGIGLFKLIIRDDNDSPFAINRFYNEKDNVQISINRSTMTFILNNFIPTNNLFVLFLSLPKTTEEFQACGI